MPQVNMIAARRAEKKKLEKRVGTMVMVAIGEVALTIALLSFMAARIYGAQRSMTNIDTQLKQVQPVVDQINAYQKQMKELQPRLDTLASSREATLLWYNVLQDLSHSMPQKTWLTNISTARQADKSNSSDGTAKVTPVVTVTLRGTAENQARVGEAMLRLGQFREFNSVDLNFTQKHADRNLNAVDFDMAAKLKMAVDNKEETSSAKD